MIWLTCTYIHLLLLQYLALFGLLGDQGTQSLPPRQDSLVLNLNGKRCGDIKTSSKAAGGA